MVPTGTQITAAATSLRLILDVDQNHRILQDVRKRVECALHCLVQVGRLEQIASFGLLGPSMDAGSGERFQLGIATQHRSPITILLTIERVATDGEEPSAAAATPDVRVP